MQTAIYNVKEWSERMRRDFVRGWEDAGGYLGDLDTPMPWCCPWYSVYVIAGPADMPPYKLR